MGEDQGVGNPLHRSYLCTVVRPLLKPVPRPHAPITVGPPSPPYPPPRHQITDMENAAFAVMIVLVTRVILAFDLNLYIPLSKVNGELSLCLTLTW